MSKRLHYINFQIKFGRERFDLSKKIPFTYLMCHCYANVEIYYNFRIVTLFYKWLGNALRTNKRTTAIICIDLLSVKWKRITTLCNSMLQDSDRVSCFKQLAWQRNMKLLFLFLRMKSNCWSFVYLFFFNMTIGIIRKDCSR